MRPRGAGGGRDFQYNDNYGNNGRDQGRNSYYDGGRGTTLRRNRDEGPRRSIASLENKRNDGVILRWGMGIGGGVGGHEREALTSLYLC